MSTKIYNAYITTLSIDNIHKYLFKLKDEYWVWCKEWVLSKYPEGKVPSYLDMMKIIEEAIRSGRNEPLNVSASVAIYPKNNYTLIQFIGFPYPLMKRWTKRPTFRQKFKDYHYQNQVDKPESISDIDWNDRSKIWDSVFCASRGWSPASAGLIMEFAGLCNISEFCLFIKEKKIIR
jgi:hypothetical protein